MTKKEFIDSVAIRADVTKKNTEAVLKEFADVITETLAKGDSVSIPGFGTFIRTERGEREGVNPSTKEKIKIPASKSAKFKPAKAMKDALN